jgi:hypothetical protein
MALKSPRKASLLKSKLKKPTAFNSEVKRFEVD